jgi:hypothetical protein
MTITILFFINEELVFRRNVCATDLYDKILDGFSEQELKRHGVPFREDDDDAIITDGDFIEMVWYACVDHGYISEDRVTVGQSVDTMHIVM